MFFTPYDLLIIPPLLLAMWASLKVKTTYAKYAKVGTRRGLTGAQVAERILRDSGVGGAPANVRGQGLGCVVEATPGNLTDHYDPRSQTLRLSEENFYGQSVAAIGVSAHEAGHAIQHAQRYPFLQLRSLMYPATAFGSNLAFPLFFIGFIGSFQPLMIAAIALFFIAVLFSVITLPVEFDASRRALKILREGGYLETDELAGARKVLRVAAMTYVAGALMAVMQLLRLVLLARGRD